MRCFLLFSIVLMGLYDWSRSAESLSDWVLLQVQKDEQLLADALTQTDGHSLELLRDSRTYIPFFLEAPGSHASALTDYEPLFDAWGNDNGQSFLSGGYIYRLMFANAPTLYATSAGFWGGSDWYSLDLGKDFAVEPSHVWNGSGDDYLFATMLAGAPPKIVVYDVQGEIKRVEVFDVNAADLEQRVATAVQTYAEKGSPVLEMLSLGEYLENPDALWREVDLSGQFNLRNQQEREAERERLKPGFHLTRNVAIEELKSKSSREAAQRTSDSSDAMPQTAEPEMSTNQKPESLMPVHVSSPAPTRWPVVIVLVVTALGLLWVLLKRKK